MNWRQFTRLSYSETQQFSQRRSIIGILLIVVVCLVAGIVSLSVNGKLTTCTATYGAFAKAQVKAGGEGCQGRTVSVGELVSKYSFTYAVAQEINQYRDETLNCTIESRSATINLLSFAAPQFLWDYRISCSRGKDCCPKNIKSNGDDGIVCFCDQTLMLHIQDFSVGIAGSQQLLSSSVSAATLNYSALSNYSTLNGTISDIAQQKCPDGSSITVLRFDNTSYSAYTSSKICSGKDKVASTFEDPSIDRAIQTMRNSIDDSITYDLQDFTIGGLNYVCYACSHSHDLSQLLLDLFVAISASGSVTYSLVLWLLRVTLRDDPSTTTTTLQLGSRGPQALN